MAGTLERWALRRDTSAGRPDPVAPAVSNLEPGFTGLTMDEASQLLRAMRGKDVIGGDVVCLLPTKDSPNQITAMAASAVMFELIGLVADRVASRR